MNPSLMTQLNNSMASGQSPMNVQTPGSPSFQPSMQPPPGTPMPDKSPASMIHIATFQKDMQQPQPPPGTPIPDESPVSMDHTATFQKDMQQDFSQTYPNLHRALLKRGINLPTASTGNIVTMPQVQDTNQQQPGVQIPLSEAELIIKALSSRLQHNTKMEQALLPSPMNPSGSVQ